MGDQRRIAWVTMIQAPPWPEGDDIYEAKDQRERIILARPEVALRDQNTGNLERKPHLFFSPSKWEITADGEDEVTIHVMGLPPGQEVQFKINGQPGRVSNDTRVPIRATAKGMITFEIDDPYVQVRRRSLTIEAKEAQGGGPG